MDHIVSNCHTLLTKYPKAGLVIGGDKNDWRIGPLITSLPKVKQIVSLPTLNLKILDVIITNLWEFYSVPLIIPPVPCDDPTNGVPSDHSTAVAYPLSTNSKVKNVYRTRIARPLPDSGIAQFGQWIVSEDWSSIPDFVSPTDQVTKFQEVIKTQLDDIFPTKTLRITQKDKAWITFELKNLDRLVKREYRRHGKSEKFLRLKDKFDSKFKIAAKDHLEKNVRSLKEENPGQAYAILKKMGAQPGDCLDEGSFKVAEHIEAKLSLAESAEKIAEHFAVISQLYAPLNVQALPKHVKDIMTKTIYPFELPHLTEAEVWQKIKHAKKPKGGVPGDLPKKLVTEFSPELATPMTKIYQNIIATQQWPSMWRSEYGIPLQKVPNPENEDQLRVISLTAFFSKVFEQFVIEWLVFHIGDKIDWRQYGGLKGSSISHYMIELINFILYNQDLKDIHAVLVVMIDFSKAFNRQDHNTLIVLLCEMGVPGWLLNIVASFLEDRELLLRYQGYSAKSRKLPGGGPQGSVLGMFLFLVLINLAGFKTQNKTLGKTITSSLNKRMPLKNIHLKFVDDMTAAEALNLKKQLVDNPDLPRPLEYHSRTEHVLPESESEILTLLNEIKDYTLAHKMKVNSQKSKVMLFNTSKKHDFKPAMYLENGKNLDIVEETTLLGIKIQSNLKWNANTDFMCEKAYKRIWMLRRLKSIGATNEELVDVYCKQIRSVLELAVPVWTAGLTASQAAQIERVQKTVSMVILGLEYRGYENSLEILKLSKLSDRRQKLNLNFAKKCIKSDKYKHWFEFNLHDQPSVQTRSVKPGLKLVDTRTARYKKSPLPYLTSMLNDNWKTIKL